jgi:hypothetical protein
LAVPLLRLGSSVTKMTAQCHAEPGDLRAQPSGLSGSGASGAIAVTGVVWQRTG